MSDNEMKAQVIVQYALQAPNGQWATNAHPDIPGGLTVDAEKAYAFDAQSTADSARRMFSEKLRQRGGTGTFRLMRREVTVLRPQYVCMDAETAITDDELEDLI